MIITLVGTAICSIILIILSFLPVVTTLPFGMDQALYTAGVWVSKVTAYIWPLEIFFKMFFFVYLPFLLTLLVLKFFLGHRAP